MTRQDEIDKCLDDFNTETCNLVFNKVMPYSKFDVNDLLKDFDHSKYLKTIGDLDEINFINLSYLSFRKKDFKVVRNFMSKQGYINCSTENQLDFTCELTDIGRLAKRLGGHDKYLRHLKLDDELKEQILSVNKSVIRTNCFLVTNGILTFIVSMISVYYIRQTFILQSNDKSHKELEGIKIELSDLHKSIETRTQWKVLNHKDSLLKN